MSKKIIQHLNPIWAEKANFIIMSTLDDSNIEIEKEQLWARQISTNKFEICCIPFFIYDLSLGDEVETDKNSVIQRIIKESGQHTFRVWAKDTPNEVRLAILNYLSDNNYLYEWYSENLFGISAMDKSSAKSLSNYLEEQERNGYLVYEIGKS
jgi:hypothetical protein